VFVSAARKRGEALDHVLLFGPAGPGQDHPGADRRPRAGRRLPRHLRPGLAKAGDLAAILTNLEPRDVLFIDEIHRLPAHVEEILYPAMEDHVARPDHRRGAVGALGPIDLAPFTLVGGHDAAGLLATPLRDRFGIPAPAGILHPRNWADPAARRA
jgi:Holliday junction DNA helicase RuvB